MLEKVNKKIIPATFDKVFKALMKSEECRDYLIEILTSITGINKDILKKGIVFVDTEYPVENVLERKKVTDLIVSIGNNVINLEMNNNYYRGLIKRNEIYYSKLRSVYGYNRYNEFNKVIQINFDNFDKYKKIISKFVIMEEKTHIKETENYEKYHINLKKINKKYYNKEKLTKLEKMLLMLTIEEEKELEKISKGDEIMEEVKDKIITLSQDDAFVLCYDEEEYREYVRRQMTEDALNEAREKAEKEIQQGLKQGLQQGALQKSKMIAKSLLKEQMEVDKIAKITGLTKEEIENL